MKKIEAVISDFYHCLSLPIQFFDLELNVIYQHGMTATLQTIYEETKVLESIHHYFQSLVHLTYMENVHFLILPLTQPKIINGYFIIGPFKTAQDYSSQQIPYKPFSCIEFIGIMLKNIVRSHLLSEHKFNPYIKESIAYLHKHYDQMITLDAICDHLNINKSYFCTIFKSDTGMTFSNFLNRIRIEKSKQYLKNSQYSILEVALAVGFNNHNYYSSIFKKFNGTTPLEYRQSILFD